jgi:hypothetical protein
MERDVWCGGVIDGRRRPTTHSTMEGSGTGIDEGARRRGNLHMTARRSEDLWANATTKCYGDDGDPLTGEEEGGGGFTSDCSGDQREKVAQCLAPAWDQDAPAHGGGRVSGGR